MARQLLKSDMQDILFSLAEVLSKSGYIETPTDDTDVVERDESKLRRRKEDAIELSAVEQTIHKLGKKTVCGTDQRGYPTPGDQAPTELVLDASEGFIPLWDYGATLRWCFDDLSLSAFENSDNVKRDVRRLMSEAILAWGASAPIKFKEETESYDFRIVVNNVNRCSPFGCTLASAFFPDSGRHELDIYPKLFEQSDKEQIDTITHEMGHIFGLRHFFASLREAQLPSVIFGNHHPFSIMNYGDQSELTSNDTADLKMLYAAVWSGAIADINGTPIRLFRPYHEAGVLVRPRLFNMASAD